LLLRLLRLLLLLVVGLGHLLLLRVLLLLLLREQKLEHLCGDLRLLLSLGWHLVCASGLHLRRALTLELLKQVVALSWIRKLLVCPVGLLRHALVCEL
jgi:hypothetical protein